MKQAAVLSIRNSFGILLIIISSLVSCQNGHQKITIVGKTEGLNGYVVSLKRGDSTLTGENVVNGQFKISTAVPEEDFYTLKFHANNQQDSDQEFLIFLSDGEYSLETDSSVSDRYPIIKSQSQVQKDLAKYYGILDKNRANFQKEFEAIKQTYDRESLKMNPASFTKISDQFVNAETRLSGNVIYSQNEFITKNPESIVSAYFLSDSFRGIEYSPDAYLKIYQKLGPTARDSKYGVTAKKLIDRYMKAAPNTILPDISGSLPDGSSFDKNSLRGKLSLVMFWMSSNKDSREDIEKLSPIYKEFHSQGFEIVGIAFDTSKERYESFLSKNALPWIQVYDAEWTKSPNIKNFGNSNLPYYFLVGPDLKIIERNPPIESISIYHKEYMKTRQKG